jgi:hypothetical protein
MYQYQQQKYDNTPNWRAAKSIINTIGAQQIDNRNNTRTNDHKRREATLTALLS